MRALGLVVLTGFLVFSSAQLRAEENPFPSQVENYLVEANYGPPEAILSPRFPHDGKMEFSFGGSYSPFSSVFQYYSANAAAVFHINRRHAIEPLWFGYNWSKRSSFVNTQIRDKIGSSAQADSRIELPQQIYATSYLFTPYYSKMTVTERTTAHFDVFFGLGLGFARTQEQFLDDVYGNKFTRVGAALTSGVRFLFPPRFGLRLEMRDFLYRMRHFRDDIADSGALTHNLQISLSASLFFGSFRD